MRFVSAMFITLFALTNCPAQSWTAAIPHNVIISGTPSASGARLRFNLTNGRIYEWNPNTSAWDVIAQGIEIVGTGLAPVTAPNYGQSPFALSTIAGVDYLYYYRAAAWHCLTCGAGGTVTTDATLAGDGSIGTPLTIAQQSATTSQVLEWTGATWEPSWGNPYTFVTTGATITTAVNEVLIGTVGADVVMGLPTCDATTAAKRFKFVKNGGGSFSVTIEPSGVQQFYPAIDRIVQIGPVSIDCTCALVSGTYYWFFDNF